MKKQPLMTQLAAAITLVSLSLAACGGDDSKPGTAVPSATTVSNDASAQYRTKAAAAVTNLGKQAETALKDMQSAQFSQSDPKWPGVLTSDADLVLAAAVQLKAVVPPAGPMEDVARRLNEAADKLSEGARSLKQSVQSADQAAGALAFANLTAGRGMLTDAAASLK
jgi:hypothetical protein